MTPLVHKIQVKDLNASLDCLKILELIGYEKSKPKISGNEIRDCCPIHRGNNPTSLSINQQKKCFKCHSCDAKGSLIDLYGLSMGLNLKEDLSKILKELAFLTHYSQKVSSNKIKEKHPNKDFSFLQNVWDNASKKGSHPYLKKKHIESCPRIRFGIDEKGNDSIVVSYKDINGTIRGIQYIGLGGKFFHKGSKTVGSFFSLCDFKSKGEVWIAEGLATACTVWESLGKTTPVLSASSKGNIPTVVKEIYDRYPQIKIKLALDIDARDILEKIEVPVDYSIPSFKGLKIDKIDKSPTDFNDLISRFGKGLEEVKRQLTLTEKKGVLEFFERLGHIIEDQKFSIDLKERSYNSFEMEHKRLFSNGGLITGFEKLDEQLAFFKGDFITFQGMSNHGKSTFMLNIGYRFLKTKENTHKNPMCLFITYESIPIRLEEKLLNIISHEYQEGTFLKYCRSSSKKYSYPKKLDFKKTIDTYNYLLKEKRMHILKRIPLEKISSIIDLYKGEFPDRTIIIFLDYIQIIDTSISYDGWEKIKNIAYTLESLAINKEVILAAASQVNEKRQAREGRDIFNASTINIDLFNHSHPSIKSNEDTKKFYKGSLNGKNLCTLEVRKQKHGPSFILEDYLLFNGHRFEENQNPSKHLKQGKFDDLR